MTVPSSGPGRQTGRDGTIYLFMQLLLLLLAQLLNSNGKVGLFSGAWNTTRVREIPSYHIMYTLLCAYSLRSRRLIGTDFMSSVNLHKYAQVCRKNKLINLRHTRQLKYLTGSSVVDGGLNLTLLLALCTGRCFHYLSFKPVAKPVRWTGLIYIYLTYSWA